MNRGRDWIQTKATNSLHPAEVESALVQLSDAWSETSGSLIDLIQGFPLGESALLRLLAMSRICVARIVREPEILRWLSRSEICLNSRGYGEMLNDLHSEPGKSVGAQNFRRLRVWKHR